MHVCFNDDLKIDLQTADQNNLHRGIRYLFTLERKKKKTPSRSKNAVLKENRRVVGRYFKPYIISNVRYKSAGYNGPFILPMSYFFDYKVAQRFCFHHVPATVNLYRHNKQKCDIWLQGSTQRTPDIRIILSPLLGRFCFQVKLWPHFKENMIPGLFNEL